jgi:hypothetical protein
VYCNYLAFAAKNPCIASRTSGVTSWSTAWTTHETQQQATNQKKTKKPYTDIHKHATQAVAATTTKINNKQHNTITHHHHHRRHIQHNTHGCTVESKASCSSWGSKAERSAHKRCK